jgi:predicted signal transduction protein with EAL and GGDEF domain
MSVLDDQQRLSLVVETDGSHSLDENMRQTLLACYREFTDILQKMAITHVSVNGELVKSNELFSEGLSLTELKGRRAVVVRVIDSKLGGTKEGYFHEKKISLLTKEDKIEEDFEKQV